MRVGVKLNWRMGRNEFAALAFFLLWVNGAGPAQCSAKERQAKQSSKWMELRAQPAINQKKNKENQFICGLIELFLLGVMGRSPSIAGRVSFQLIQSISISLPLIPSPSIQQLAERENKQAVHQLFIFLFQFKSLSTHFILIQFKLFLFIDWLIWKESNSTPHALSFLPFNGAPLRIRPQWKKEKPS